MTISVVILTFNSALVIGDTVRAAGQVSDDIHIVDSFSTDDTMAIARGLGATIVQRAFVDYAEQRNWAIDNLPLKYSWQLHLDADEILSDELIAAIRAHASAWPSDIDGFFIPRLTRFLGRELRHGGYYPNYHMRLFRKGHAVVEHRKYDQHFVLTGRSATIEAPLIDDHRMSLTEWTARHNRWSELEVLDVSTTQAGLTLKPDFSGTPPERQRAKKSLYYRQPPFGRALGLFLYRYVYKRGFLDGKPGLIYCVLQAFWYRFLVDAKLYEKHLAENRGRSPEDRDCGPNSPAP